MNRAPIDHEIPDVLAFASDALTARGALVEASDDGHLVVLPPALAKELALPEACTLSATGREAPDVAACAIGSPLLDRLGEALRVRVPFAALASGADAPRAGQARALAERFVIRNAVFEITGVSPADAPYVVAWFAWRAEADDRYDGTFGVAVHAESASEPDAAIVALADPRRQASGLTPGLFAPSPPGDSVVERIAQRATTRARSAIARARTAVARRHERDHRRIDEYFAALARDTMAPKRRIERAAIERKLAHLASEREAKLRDLLQRYALRVSLEPIALVALSVPTARVQLRVRRRKREGELVLRLPATAASLDWLACATCGGTTPRPAVCDDALHLLCEECAPQAQGRPHCGAC
jgi:hypothetical protein